MRVKVKNSAKSAIVLGERMREGWEMRAKDRMSRDREKEREISIRHIRLRKLTACLNREPNFVHPHVHEVRSGKAQSCKKNEANMLASDFDCKRNNDDKSDEDDDGECGAGSGDDL